MCARGSPWSRCSTGRVTNRAGGLADVPEIAASTGSACHEGDVRLSPVLAAMNLPVDVARGSVRLSLGRFTTETEVDRAAEALVRRGRSGA
jgi:cysteine desulfurase